MRYVCLEEMLQMDGTVLVSLATLNHGLMLRLCTAYGDAQPVHRATLFQINFHGQVTGDETISQLTVNFTGA